MTEKTASKYLQIDFQVKLWNSRSDTVFSKHFQVVS